MLYMDPIWKKVLSIDWKYNKYIIEFAYTCGLQVAVAATKCHTSDVQVGMWDQR